MSVLASFIVGEFVGMSGNTVTIHVYGQSSDGTKSFRNANEGGISTSVNVTSTTFNADIEAGVKSALIATPWNMTFNTGDTVRLLIRA